ncbi:MAG: Tyrosine--tRNA ligase [candidate division WS2 bacterium ADurb.Bin280]|uniref:Tyrosine--tRNA ligase n=1 Tax=candidate division WS2 bacterium ADurb.Bin280 TaxID=1852829 RepID=A0A1V5SF17_9BACT|nr:MAG: Tyrosine--tRNA ligase [candidate division WS2 bacterium ADurb.Bin280]
MDKIEELLTRGVENIYPDKETLEKVLRSGKKIKLYQGFDPTGPQLHIGHMAGLMKLRQFQKLGHKVIFLIGDVTATIGDPSGKTTARKVLSREEVNENAKNYTKQASKILDFEGENPVEVKFNSEWFDKMSALEFAAITHHLTYAQISERDLFQERKKANQDVYMNEFFYPLLQAYDSVAMDIDLEVGGNDQMFNMMMGRKLIRNMKQKEKFVMTLSLLSDAQGKKIGKTEGNVIALDSKSEDLYGMIMKLPDEVIIKCFELITEVDLADIERIKNEISGGENPMKFKRDLAYELVRMLNNEEAAKSAAEHFDIVVRAKETPEDILEKEVDSKTIVDLLVEVGFASSKSDAKRLLDQRAVKIDGEETSAEQSFETGESFVLKSGKLKFIRVKVK